MPTTKPGPSWRVHSWSATSDSPTATEALRELARAEPPPAPAVRAGLFGRGRVAEGAEARRVRSPTAPGTAGLAAGALPLRGGALVGAPARPGRSFAEP